MAVCQRCNKETSNEDYCDDCLDELDEMDTCPRCGQKKPFYDGNGGEWITAGTIPRDSNLIQLMCADCARELQDKLYVTCPHCKEEFIDTTLLPESVNHYYKYYITSEVDATLPWKPKDAPDGSGETWCRECAKNWSNEEEDE